MSCGVGSVISKIRGCAHKISLRVVVKTTKEEGWKQHLHLCLNFFVDYDFTDYYNEGLRLKWFYNPASLIAH